MLRGNSRRSRHEDHQLSSNILRIPEDDPLANMPEEAGRKRPVVILRLRTDNGIEGIGVTFYGGAHDRQRCASRSMSSAR